MKTLSDLRGRTQWAIDHVMEKYNLTIADIGKAVGSRPDTIQKYRSKRVAPRRSFLVKFCSIYGMDPKWMVKGDGQPFPEKLGHLPKPTYLDESIKTETHTPADTDPTPGEYRGGCEKPGTESKDSLPIFGARAIKKNRPETML